MDMSKTMAMSATTTEATEMPTPVTSPSMTMMGAHSMAMTFFVSSSTPLWSTSLNPHNAGEYAGICIFLIALGTMFRMLLAVRVNFPAILAAFRQKRYNNLIPTHADESVVASRPWRADEAVMMATLDVVVAGVSYLLMLAVMTFNVGYFISVLGGVFFGSLLCGRYTGNSVTH